MIGRVTRSDDEWREVLTEEQYQVTRQKGTEAPFTGRYYRSTGRGTYRCVCCGNVLFTSRTKFESASGWPSFWSPVSRSSVRTVTDISFGMIRVEVLCARCDAHLGHVFEDGPPPTGQRYCINSIALEFVAEG